MKPNITTTSIVWMIIATLIVGLSVFGVFYSAVTKEHQLYYAEIGKLANGNMKETADRLISNLRESALAVSEIDPLIRHCQMPNQGYNESILVNLFNALSHNPARQLGSLGLLRYAANTTNGKWSWQIARNFGCIPYMYAYADPSIFPTFLGYCVGNTTVAYNGTDWGLKPEEYDLLLTRPNPQREIFLPITPLLGQLMLTTEQSLSCDNQTVYGATFAEQSLVQLDDALQTEQSSNLMFIMEAKTGYMIAASLDNQTMTSNGSRILAAQAPNRDVASMAVESASGDWAVFKTEYKIGTTIHWILVTGVPTKGFLSSIREASSASIGWSMGIIVAMVIITGVGYYLLIGRPMRRILEGEKAEEAENFLIAEVDMVSQLTKKNNQRV